MNSHLKKSGEHHHRSFLQLMQSADLTQTTLSHQFQEASGTFEGASNLKTKLAGKNMKPIQPHAAAGQLSKAFKMEPSIKVGMHLYEQARYTEAEVVLTGCLEEACESNPNNVTMDQALFVRALTALATLYQAQSKYDAAMKLHERAIPLARALAKEDEEEKSQYRPQFSLGLANNIAGYAETLRKLGDLPQAERYHREAQALRLRAVEEKYATELELAVSYTQLGCTLAAMRQHEEAYQQHHRALTMRYRFLNFSHGLVSESLNYCAESLCVLGRAGEGIPLALHAAKIRKSIYGTSHPAYAHALSVLASCYHAVGRHFDAADCLVECLGICEHAFPQGHANMIPNLINYGSVLRATGDLARSKIMYEHAMSIHKLIFKEGQKAWQLQKCQVEIAKLSPSVSKSAIVRKPGLFSSFSMSSIADSLAEASADIDTKGTPVIVFTDIGRDVDDEMALVVLSALKRKCMLNPIAVITTLSPVKDRANLARGSLDTMGMADVPVGIGGRGGVADGVDLEVYEADHARSSPSIVDSGMELACQALESVPDKSVQIVCLASLSDTATLIREHQELFTTKVKEVVIMGGVMPMDSSETLAPDTAYNNNCDMQSANYVYQRCQELGVPTATLSRWAAYGCPIRPKLMDELAKTKHMVAANIRRKSKHSLDQLWNKVILPEDHPGREKLPARCNVNWFYKTFCGTDVVPKELPESIWSNVEKLNMYDPLAVLICVESYRSLHFNCKIKTVNGVDHVVLGTSETDTGVKDVISLYKEYSHLFIAALQDALHEPEMPAGSEKAPDMLLEETTQIYKHRRNSLDAPCIQTIRASVLA